MNGKSKGIKSVYVCSECGYESAKWYGKCPGCGSWNTMAEELREPPAPALARAAKAAAPAGHASVSVAMSDLNFEDDIRYPTGLNELDRVLGG